MALVAGCNIGGLTYVWSGSVGPRLTTRNLTACWAEVALGTTDSGTTTEEVESMAGGALIDIQQCLITVEGETVFVDPALSYRVGGPDMAIVTAGRWIAIGTV